MDQPNLRKSKGAGFGSPSGPSRRELKEYRPVEQTPRRKQFGLQPGKNSPKVSETKKRSFLPVLCSLIVWERKAELAIQ